MPSELSTESAGAPHGGMPVAVSGEPIESAKLVVVLLHGRGGNASEMLTLAAHLDCTQAAFLAPQAAGSSWYPASFLAPFESNQPGIDSAHRVIESVIESTLATRSSPPSVALLGFSQGACLAVDHAYRFPRRYGFVAALTGGLIGPSETIFDPHGSLSGTPVFLGASNPDPHVPWARVQDTASVLTAMDADIQLESYDRAPHAVLPEQILRVTELAQHAIQGIST